MLKTLIEIAKETGAILTRYFRSELAIGLKDDRSPLTRADVEANAFIIQRLRGLDPRIPIISEESKLPTYKVRKRWQRYWLLDPLDGTKEFIHHIPEFTVNIALIAKSIPVMSVVYAPALGVLYYAQKGKGAWKQTGRGRPSRIYASKPRKGHILLVVESRYHRAPEADILNHPKLFSSSERRLISRWKIDRIHVGSSLKFCYLAEGKVHLYPRSAPCMEWDAAAGDCIYRNAAKGTGQNPSPLAYNKPSLKNGPFVLGRHHL